MPKGVYEHKSHQGLQKGHKLNEGRKMSEETKKKLSDAKKGKPLHENAIKGADKARASEYWGEWNKGVIRDEDLRRRIGEGVKAFYKIPENREKISGENSHMWLGGLTPEMSRIRNSFKYRQWRSDVFTRDEYICQDCGLKGCGNLNADHTKPFSAIIKENNIETLEQAMECDELWNINNGRTLCEDCHRKTDTYGGKARTYKTKDCVDWT